MLWYEAEGREFSPVLSTRVRFARNVEGVPFPHLLGEKDRIALRERVRESYGEKGTFFAFDTLPAAEKEAYLAMHLVSHDLIRRGAGTGFIQGKGGESSLMICEEDHLRIQAILPGTEIQGALQAARDFAKPAEKLGLAYREGLGYLTACPTNLGAACRISVLIHLPALHALHAVEALAARLTDGGFTLRGAMGEGSGAGAGLVQISNQQSREKTPARIAADLEEILAVVEEKEREALGMLRRRDLLTLEDTVSRAVGTLRYGRKMNYEEFSSLYLTLRFGRALGLEVARECPLKDRHLVELSPGAMVLGDARLTDAALRDRARSERIRALMKEE